VTSFNSFWKYSDWPGLLERVKKGESLDEFYFLITSDVFRGICGKYSLEHVDDQLHDLFLILVSAIQRDLINDPMTFVGYSLVTAKRVAIQQIRARKYSELKSPMDQGPNAFEQLATKERWEITNRALNTLDHLEESVLRRFYLESHTRETICSDLGITTHAFGLKKSRAKAKFVMRVQEMLKPKKRYL